ncbi:DNA/RNA helicase domain-containing protein [Bacillus pseudomycoides]|uniref:DNA/RNA helicase domain-containing protein n=1 Tax=Bacillus pseudomycoides TaxID=64104 RepID=UPI00159BD894|nr:DNA/RNA helicase domain-containing protein [Bacillus pseudomycoides]
MYTAQGLDYDYTGFIWYDDLYWDNNTKSWKFNLDVMRDATFVNQARLYLQNNNANYKQAYQDILTLVLNQYYVLLTRARKGIYD